MKVQKNFTLLLLLLIVLQYKNYAQNFNYKIIGTGYLEIPARFEDTAIQTYSLNTAIPNYIGNSLDILYKNNPISHLKKVTEQGDLRIEFYLPEITPFANNIPIINEYTNTIKINNGEEEEVIINYTKSCIYNQAYSFKIINNLSGKILEEFTGSWIFTVTTSEYPTPKSVHDIWESYSSEQIGEICRAKYLSLIEKFNTSLNQLLHKTFLKTTIDIYIPDEKEEFSTLTTAHKIAKNAYHLINNKKEYPQVEFEESINAAIEIWNNFLMNQPASLKPQKRKEIRNGIYFNLANAYLWKKDWESAYKYASKIKKNKHTPYQITAVLIRLNHLKKYN